MRLVKTIGDAAMLASPEPEPLLDAALALIDAAEAEGGDFPQLRAGAALGLALPTRRRLVRAARSTSPAASPRSPGPAACWSTRELHDARRRATTAGPSPASAACAGSASRVALFRMRRAAARGGLRRAALASGASAGALASRSPRAAIASCRRQPRRRSRGPQVVQRDRVLVGVHALPEALVAVGAQLAGARPAARAARARARCRAPDSRGTRRSKQKKPPLIQCSERGFSRKPVTRSSRVELGRPRTAAAGARRSSSRARRGRRGRRAGRRGRCRRARPRRSRRSAARRASSGAQQLDAPARSACRAPVSTHSHLHARGPALALAAKRSISSPRSRWRARSARSPGRRTAGSRATRSACRRSRRAAWGSRWRVLLQARAAPAAQDHDRRARPQLSRRRARAPRRRRRSWRAPRSTSSLSSSTLDQPHQLARLASSIGTRLEGR